MALNLKLQMRLSQQLIMTPQLQQAIKLLQLSRTELEELVEQALMQRGREARLHAARARYLRQLTRLEDARQAVAQAMAAGIDSPELQRLDRSLRRQ